MSWSVNRVDKRGVNVVFCLTFTVVVLLCCFFAAKYAILKLRVSFAEGQISIFEAMKSSLDNITNPQKLSAELEYVVNYYPSGSKQVRGSQLDRIVEIARANATSEIINRLHAVTAKDLGNDPQRWIKEYPPKP